MSLQKPEPELADRLKTAPLTPCSHLGANLSFESKQSTDIGQSQALSAGALMTPFR